MDEEQFLTVYFAVVAGLFGAAIGSFLNVVIYRLPAGQSVVRPRSHCRCGAAIAWYDNIPVLSWFVLRGRCRHCRERFSFRYPLVEAATAALFVGLWLVGGWPVGVVWMVFAGLMIPAALIDLDTMEIPDVFSIGGFMVGILASAIVPALHGEAVSGIAIVDGMRGLTAGLLGAFVGSAMVLWVALCAEVVLRKEAMGFGDVKLMGAIGAFCGWQGAVFAFFGGAVLGLLMLVVAWPWLRNSNKGEGEAEESVAGRIPFGPSLAGAALLYLLWFQPYVDGYFANIHELLQSF
jgi:leader peptidase (prepilin peptidase)/N-methyltransferase